MRIKNSERFFAMFPDFTIKVLKKMGFEYQLFTFILHQSQY